MHRVFPLIFLATLLCAACSDDTVAQDSGLSDQEVTKDVVVDAPVKADQSPDKAKGDGPLADKTPPKDKAPPPKDKAAPDQAPPDSGGTLPKYAACNTANDKCGPGLKCCLTCCGQPLPDGSTTPTHTCVTPDKSGNCPPPPP